MAFERKHQTKEVIPGLMLGGIADLQGMLDWQPDVLVPLDHLPGYVWETGFRGEVLYYPIMDYCVLPADVLDRLVDAVTDRLRAGKKVAMFCIGGHGRTGYAASCILFQLGIENPVAFLRQNYSMSAVETDEQEEEVRRFCDRHVAVTYWGCIQQRWEVRVKSIPELRRDPDVRETQLRIQEELGRHARILIHPSGAPPTLRVLVEAPDPEQCRQAFEAFRTILEKKNHLLGVEPGQN